VLPCRREIETAMLCAQCLRRLDTNAQRCPTCMADPLLAGRYRLDRPLEAAAGESSYRATRVEDGLLARARAVNLDHTTPREPLRAVAARIAKLDHRGLPRMIEHCEITGETERLWLIHEYVRGRTLAELVLAEPERKRDLAWLLGILAELAAVLAYLHGQSPAIAHGQISASSILVADGSDLRVRLLDLQLSDRRSDPAADVRALGSLLASWDVGHVDSQLGSLIARMLDETPERQITSAALREAVDGLVRARGYEERRSPPTLALTRRPTPRFVRIEQVQSPDGSVSQASHPVPAASGRGATRRPSGDIPVMRPDELSRELSQAYRASAEIEQREHKQLVFARVGVVLLVAMITALVTYLAMH
jgi:hypothetical protein